MRWGWELNCSDTWHGDTWCVWSEFPECTNLDDTRFCISVWNSVMIYSNRTVVECFFVSDFSLLPFNTVLKCETVRDAYFWNCIFPLFNTKTSSTVLASGLTSREQQPLRFLQSLWWNSSGWHGLGVGTLVACEILVRVWWEWGTRFLKWRELLYSEFYLKQVDHHHCYFLASDVVVKCLSDSDISCGNCLSIILNWKLQYFPCR